METKSIEIKHLLSFSHLKSSNGLIEDFKHVWFVQGDSDV